MTAASGAARLPTGRLILASTSRTRQRLLEQAGFAFETCVASIDEVSPVTQAYLPSVAYQTGCFDVAAIRTAPS